MTLWLGSVEEVVAIHFVGSMIRVEPESIEEVQQFPADVFHCRHTGRRTQVLLQCVGWVQGLLSPAESVSLPG